MAQQQTQPYKRTMSGSIGAGFGSLVNGGRRYYILEHRTASAYHKAGESQKIIVDQVEIGRSSTCQVRFDESFPTVSRRHAAIVKDGEGWKLVQLSETNSTYLNGQKVAKEWYLQNGDEIQLSTGGPKLGFIVPQGEKSMVKSIGLSQRLSLFRQQALRPYKRALVALTCVFVVALGVGGYFLIDSNRQLSSQKEIVAQLRENLETDRKNQEEALRNSGNRIKSLQKELDELKRKNYPTPPPSPTPVPNNPQMSHIYLVYTKKYEITNGEGKVVTFSCTEGKAPLCYGTGFLLDNGYFVTARHVCRPWDIWDEDNSFMVVCNVYSNMNLKVKCTLGVRSPDGREYEIQSDAFVVDATHDITGTIELEDMGSCKISSIEKRYDYAFAKTNWSGGFLFDADTCDRLPVEVKLFTWGYPENLGVKELKPHYSEAKVSVDGLESGVINTTGTGFDHGNSGGPVFYAAPDGKPVVVGIVHGGTRSGKNGFVVPISVIKK